MGRTNPTYRDRLGAVENEWSAFRRARRALRGEDQFRFDHLFMYARDRADAAGHLNHSDLLAPVWMAIALEQERRIAEPELRVDSLTDT
ncbi:MULTISPECIES: hypothetical protein [unclassified Halorubrum]|uniref:hypothetical protein n=1 Tax=unclassified Halorubrum TaxID=2642239 RepID=UPI000B992F8E|nr:MULTISPECIES: hypothetical protein [unclassified Halorubrum]OYR43392.1 hypothetical protein DJ81_09465 [Halorubrum sp. Hd13]OYR49077.1 hypothetical protein DJ74_09180 [Halorubrum sp. Ea8]